MEFCGKALIFNKETVEANVIRPLDFPSTSLILDSHQYIKTYFVSATIRPTDVNFYMRLLLRAKEQSYYKWPWSWSYDEEGHTVHIMVKPFKIFFYGTKKPITLCLGMLHWGCRSCQICWNDEPSLTMNYFMARPNLFPYALNFGIVKPKSYMYLLIPMGQWLHTSLCRFM